MKKLSIMIMLLMWFNMILPTTLAANEDDNSMAELSELLGEEDTGSTNTDTNTDEDTGDTNADEEKVMLEEWDVTSNSAKLTLKPIDGYNTYKVYYNKEGDEDNIDEKEVTTTWSDDTEVEITGLEPATTYNVVAKAFDEDGNPIESTTSDPLTITTKDAQHAAPADNVIYNPTVKAYDKKIVISYKPGMDVKKVQISMSDDGQTFKPVAVVDASITTYTINVDKAGKKYIKIVPVAEDGTLWVCKIGATDVPFLTVEPKTPTKQEVKKQAVKNVGKAKTGPETYFLIILAVLAYVVYARRKMKA